MRLKSLIVLLLTGSVLLSGCFEIFEEVHYKKDGSGTYTFAMDMSGMKSMLEMAMQMDTSQQGEFQLDTLKMISEEFENNLQGANGISNIRQINDMENFVFGIEFDFKDITSLNSAVEKITKDENQESVKGPFFKAKGKQFQRLDARGFKGLFDEMLGGAGADDENMDMAMMFLKDVAYTMTYHFERKIKSVSNSLSEISEDNKTVTTKYYLFDEERGGENATIENTIKLK